MKVFATRFLEKPSTDEKINVSDWSWTPANSEAIDIYASGNATYSRQSTYAAEKNDRSDCDRPKEGLYIA
ncbi:hypothetical protein [Psychrobacillus sp. L3]|uniref:hypothetical protein n=1 Tax=Psychrobacillus sp. L3 TaxID=3236891 RepID=UPI0036F39171